MVLPRSLLSLLVLALCGTVLADVAPVMQRRKKSHGSKSGGGSSGNPSGSGSDKYGDPGIKCDAITQPASWTVDYDPIPAGCYEEGQNVPIQWTIKATSEVPGSTASGTPVLSWGFYFAQDGSFTIIPGAKPTKLGPKPFCAAKGSGQLSMPPKGTFTPKQLWPIDKTVYGLAAFEWLPANSTVKGVSALNEVPSRSNLNEQTGFVIAGAGGCKGYPGGGDGN